jgi:hypothetical protein
MPTGKYSPKFRKSQRLRCQSPAVLDTSWNDGPGVQDFLALKMKSLCSVVTSVNINQSTLRHIAERTMLSYKTTSYRSEEINAFTLIFFHYSSHRIIPQILFKLPLIFFPVALRPNAGHGLLILRFLDHTQRHITVDRTPL